jgi:hypothetical protein
MYNFVKDKYIYYYCIHTLPNTSLLHKTYSCKPYDDPLDILKTERVDHPEHKHNTQDWVILPVHRYYPQWYHQRYLEKKLSQIRVDLIIPTKKEKIDEIEYNEMIREI